jgi:hypothetical protein
MTTNEPDESLRDCIQQIISDMFATDIPARQKVIGSKAERDAAILMCRHLNYDHALRMCRDCGATDYDMVMGYPKDN